MKNIVLLDGYFSTNWCKYTKDAYILDIITNGLKSELNEIPKHNNMHTHPSRSFL